MLTLLKVRKKASQGFSLVEVTIGILLMFVFMGAAMQTLVAAAAIKIKAVERSEASSWIQEDLELVRYSANQLAANPALCSATTNITGYADALRDNFTGTASATTTTTQSFTRTSRVSPRTYTLTRDIGFKNATVMTLNYTVTPAGQTTPLLAQARAEVTPDQSFKCP